MKKPPHLTTDSPAIILIDRRNDPASASRLADRLSIPIAESPGSDTKFILWLLPEGLSIQPNTPLPPSPLRAEFVSGKAAYRRQQGEMIVKAVNIRGKSPVHVLDATAGLGRDAFVLASHGFYVTLIERNPVIHALLADALERAVLDAATRAIVERMTLHQADTADWLENTFEKPDVIYLDPMFPSRRKSAQVKKEMSIFQRLLGKPDDAGPLLTCCLEAATRKVVVKRPIKAPTLGSRKPAYDLRGKSTRFDVYPT